LWVGKEGGCGEQQPRHALHSSLPPTQPSRHQPQPQTATAAAAHLVVLHQLARVLGHVGGLDRVDLFGARLGGKDGEDAAAGADVQHDLAVELAAVLEDGVVVGAGALVVLQHVLLRSCVCGGVFLWGAGGVRWGVGGGKGS